MRVALIDYGSGNLRSAEKALARAASERGTAHEICVTSDPGLVREADRIVLPGVGAFADCMRGLSSVYGMKEALTEAVVVGGRPFLGICVGMQLMASVGREFGDTPGLGWIEGEVTRLQPADPALKIPHMGWNALQIVRPHPILDDVSSGSDVYFVHSFAMATRHPSDVVATTEYGGVVSAIVGRDNFVGTQFHPEKSQAIGIRLLANFLAWAP